MITLFLFLYQLTKSLLYFSNTEATQKPKDYENKFFENPKDFSWKLRDRKEPIFLVQLCQLDFDKYDGDLDYKL